MKGKFKNLFVDSLIQLSVILSIIFLLIESVLLFTFFPKLSPYIPFFNSMPWGEDRLASSTSILFLPAVFVIVLLLNNFLGAFFYEKNPLITRVLSLSAFLFIFLGFLASLQIIFLVF